MSDVIVDPLEYKYHVEILFGEGGSHLCTMYSDSTDLILQYIHSLVHLDELRQKVLLSMLSSVPTEDVVEALLEATSLHEVSKVVGNIEVGKYEHIVAGLAVSKEEYEEHADNIEKYLEENAVEMRVGVKYHFGNNDTFHNIIPEVDSLHSTHDLFEAATVAIKDMHLQGDINTTVMMAG